MTANAASSPAWPPLSWVYQRLPYATIPACRSAMVTLQKLPRAHWNSATLEACKAEPEHIKQRTAEVLKQVRIQDATEHEVTELEPLNDTCFPEELLPNAAGIRLRYRYGCRYKAATEEHIAEVEAANAKCAADIAHRQKLLHDLPIALKNSKQVMKAAITNGEELWEVGAIAVEQHRIELEIESQRRKLPALKNTPLAAVDPAKFVWKFGSVIDFHFGTNVYEGKAFHLSWRS